MNWTPLTDDMRRFILLNIPSVPYLEALLLMRDEENYHWCKEELAKRLYINVDRANDLLSQLCASGIIEKDDKIHTYYYHPCTEEMRETIDQLAVIYSKNLIEVTNLIHSNIEKKAHKFANAFILRKDK